MSRNILLITLLLNIVACNSTEDKPVQNIITEKEMLSEYLFNIHKLSIDSSLTYCILYFADNCTICNAPSEPIIDSILTNTNSHNQIVITTKREHTRPIFYQPNSKVLIDTADMLARYGITYPRHMLMIYHNKKMNSEIEIIADNKGFIDSLIHSSSPAAIK